ncbi:MAG: hypothetical protein LUC30_04265 [Clostridiales bacterium]|nr:hypothetical protein [Clostridiales bacterium]
MKKHHHWGKRMAACMIAGLLLLSGCSGSDEDADTTGDTGDTEASASDTAAEETEDYVLSFVAADKTNWDMEVTFGSYVYTIAVNLSDDNTFALVGTCVSGAEIANEDGTTEEVSLTEDEMAAAGFEIDGTWSYEEGWGYTLTFDDGNDTTITADFDTASSRHYFYYNLTPTVNGETQETTQVEFQVQDTDFRQSIADDYVIAEERNAVYIFSAKGTSGNGNATSLNIYLQDSGNVAVISESGTSTTYSTGTWTEDEANHVLSVTVGGSTSVADYCDTEGKEGYRLNYVTTSMWGTDTQTCYYPLVDGVSADDYTDEDFEGATLYTMTCEEGDYTIDLTEKGFAVLYSSGSRSETASYTYDESSDTYTITLSDQTLTTTNNEGTYSVEASFVQTSMWGDGETLVRTLSFTK